MVIESSPTRTSLTKRRTIRWRSVTLSVSAALRRRASNIVRVSAKRRNAGAVVDLICDCLKFGTECLLALTQCRHAFPQLLNGQKPFLIGGEKSFDQAPPLAVAFRLVGQALRAEERTPCTSHSIARGHVRRDLSVHQPLQLLPIAIAGICSDGLRILTLPLTTGRTSQDAYARLTTMPEM